MDKGLKVEGGDKIGKTIIFARNHNHAVFIEERFNAIYPRYQGTFLRVIDNYNTYAHTLLDSLKDPNKEPQIAVSVDMLDTGIDIPEILNLVFFKPVKSSSKYWQMIGRGTRLCPDIFGPGQDKKCFYIFDFCENFEFFQNFPNGVEGSGTKSLSQRIFETRLQLAFEIEKPEHTDDSLLQGLKNNLLDFLHKEIAALDSNNISVRLHLRWVEIYKDRAQWSKLKQQDLSDIKQHISHLPGSQDDDEMAKRFDFLILRLQLAILTISSSQPFLKDQVISLAESLTRKTSIPSVASRISSINSIQTKEFWKNINLNILEQVRKELRELIKFIDREKQATIYTDFEDTISGEWKEIDILPTYTSLEAYRKRVERIVLQNRHHITISKLQSNIPITSHELQELERMLFENEEAGNKEKFRKALGEKPLGIFIRSILGLDINAAKVAFGEFLNHGKLTGDQINFINKIIDFLSVNGTIDAKLLYESPFTDENDAGLTGVFDEEAAHRILDIIENINHNAIALGA